MSWDLPYSLTVGGVEYPINYDYRDALDALDVFSAPDLTDLNKIYAMLEIIYGENIPKNRIEAAKQATWFLDGGDVVKSDRERPKTMDYKQDAPLLFSAVNKVAGYEVRNPDIDIHWWTFMGYCNEIDPESSIANIVQIRTKLAKGKKLEKHEQEYYNENRHLVDFADSGNIEDILDFLRKG